MKQKNIKFNEQNEDVYDILDALSKHSQYTCDAIRFYEAIKKLTGDKADPLQFTHEAIRYYEDYLKNLKGSKIDLLEQSSNIGNDILEIKNKIYHLENLIKNNSNNQEVYKTKELAIDDELHNQILDEED